MSAGRADAGLRLVAIVLALVGLARRDLPDLRALRGHRARLRLGGDCEKVQTSEWSKLAGVPVALLGLVGYAAILALALRRPRGGLVAGALVSLAGFGFSAYLTYRELFSIDAICPWCVASAVIMTAAGDRDHGAPAAGARRARTEVRYPT